MTLIIDDLFINIDEIYTKKHGDKWIEVIGVEKYFTIRNKYELLSKEEQKAFDDGELLF